MTISLRDFKEIFVSKPTNYSVTIFSSKDNIKEKYDTLDDFYNDDYCDDFFVHFIKVLAYPINNIFIDIKFEV